MSDDRARIAARLRPARADDREAVWLILEPIIRAGETYALPRDMTREAALDYWFSPGHAVFVAEEEQAATAGDRGPRIILGTYYLRANQQGGGDHVANCGYMTAPAASGRGVARAMALHSLAVARERGFQAMQFNFVVASNERAVHLWQSLGFAIVGRSPRAFRHPALGHVDALVMLRAL